MKKLLIVISLSVLLGCNTKKESGIEESGNIISEEIKLDSLGLEKIFADSTLKAVAASEIENLTKNLSDTSLFAGLDEGFRRLDSIKNAGEYKNYLSKLDIGMYKDIRAVHFKNISLSDSKSLILWGFDYSSYEACPYANGKVIFANVVENGQNISCMPFAYFHNWADAPFYENFKTSSVLDQNGNLTINETKTSGGVDEKDKDYQNSVVSKHIFKM